MSAFLSENNYALIKPYCLSVCCFFNNRPTLLMVITLFSQVSSVLWRMCFLQHPWSIQLLNLVTLYFRPLLQFITWTSNDLEPPENARLCPMPPHVAIEACISLLPVWQSAARTSQLSITSLAWHINAIFSCGLGS